ncbi:hypothetical protein TRFO_17930 [Tritrichomonas foetus]|uniref:Uncharacterized protein n=1 Tax=Tritrichomonas foetus TaxID=1144522 RepID=A0A1J4KMG5_9EUKA|nr:hypothetical protein TRFO_17930 [Tritrichomonas foetus]|eukprot:OHT12338.1 hypothetical protein TRFO_17930 [Tritrichomonas foetus]
MFPFSPKSKKEEENQPKDSSLNESSLFHNSTFPFPKSSIFSNQSPIASNIKLKLSSSNITGSPVKEAPTHKVPLSCNLLFSMNNLELQNTHTKKHGTLAFNIPSKKSENSLIEKEKVDDDLQSPKLISKSEKSPEIIKEINVEKKNEKKLEKDMKKVEKYGKKVEKDVKKLKKDEKKIKKKRSKFILKDDYSSSFEDDKENAELSDRQSAKDEIGEIKKKKSTKPRINRKNSSKVTKKSKNTRKRINEKTYPLKSLPQSETKTRENLNSEQIHLDDVENNNSKQLTITKIFHEPLRMKTRLREKREKEKKFNLRNHPKKISYKDESDDAPFEYYYYDQIVYSNEENNYQDHTAEKITSKSLLFNNSTLTDDSHSEELNSDDKKESYESKKSSENESDEVDDQLSQNKNNELLTNEKSDKDLNLNTKEELNMSIEIKINENNIQNINKELKNNEEFHTDEYISQNQELKSNIDTNENDNVVMKDESNKENVEFQVDNARFQEENNTAMSSSQLSTNDKNFFESFKKIKLTSEKEIFKDYEISPIKENRSKDSECHSPVEKYSSDKENDSNNEANSFKPSFPFYAAQTLNSIISIKESKSPEVKQPDPEENTKQNEEKLTNTKNLIFRNPLTLNIFHTTKTENNTMSELPEKQDPIIEKTDSKSEISDILDSKNIIFDSKKVITNHIETKLFSSNEKVDPLNEKIDSLKNSIISSNSINDSSNLMLNISSIENSNIVKPALDTDKLPNLPIKEKIINCDSNNDFVKSDNFTESDSIDECISVISNDSDFDSKEAKKLDYEDLINSNNIAKNDENNLSLKSKSIDSIKDVQIKTRVRELVTPIQQFKIGTQYQQFVLNRLTVHPLQGKSNEININSGKQEEKLQPSMTNSRSSENIFTPLMISPNQNPNPSTNTTEKAINRIMQLSKKIQKNEKNEEEAPKKAFIPPFFRENQSKKINLDDDDISGYSEFEQTIFEAGKKKRWKMSFKQSNQEQRKSPSKKKTPAKKSNDVILSDDLPDDNDYLPKENKLKKNSKRKSSSNKKKIGEIDNSSLDNSDDSLQISVENETNPENFQMKNEPTKSPRKRTKSPKNIRTDNLPPLTDTDPISMIHVDKGDPVKPNEVPKFKPYQNNVRESNNLNKQLGELIDLIVGSNNNKKASLKKTQKKASPSLLISIDDSTDDDNVIIISKDQFNSSTQKNSIETIFKDVADQDNLTEKTEGEVKLGKPNKQHQEILSLIENQTENILQNEQPTKTKRKKNTKLKDLSGSSSDSETKPSNEANLHSFFDGIKSQPKPVKKKKRRSSSSASSSSSSSSNISESEDISGFIQLDNFYKIISSKNNSSRNSKNNSNEEIEKKNKKEPRKLDISSLLPTQKVKKKDLPDSSNIPNNFNSLHFGINSSIDQNANQTIVNHLAKSELNERKSESQKNKLKTQKNEVQKINSSKIENLGSNNVKKIKKIVKDENKTEDFNFVANSPPKLRKKSARLGIEFTIPENPMFEYEPLLYGYEPNEFKLRKIKITE